MVELVVGVVVTVLPNLASFHEPDRREAPWLGRVVYVTERSVGVEPLDGNLPRDVLKERVSR